MQKIETVHFKHYDYVRDSGGSVPPMAGVTFRMMPALPFTPYAVRLYGRGANGLAQVTMTLPGGPTFSLRREDSSSSQKAVFLVEEGKLIHAFQPVFLSAENCGAEAIDLECVLEGRSTSQETRGDGEWALAGDRVVKDKPTSFHLPLEQPTMIVPYPCRLVGLQLRGNLEHFRVVDVRAANTSLISGRVPAVHFAEERETFGSGVALDPGQRVTVAFEVPLPRGMRSEDACVDAFALLQRTG